MAIKIEEEFDVDVPREQAWAFFSDPRKVAPCLPGAELTEVVDERNYKGRVKVQVGPVVATYDGTIAAETMDEVSGTMIMVARAAQVGAAGRAEGHITCRVQSLGERHTHVAVTAEFTIAGRLMQLAGGLIGSVTKRLMGEFVRRAEQSIS